MVCVLLVFCFPPIIPTGFLLLWLIRVHLCMTVSWMRCRREEAFILPLLLLFLLLLLLMVLLETLILGPGLLESFPRRQISERDLHTLRSLRCVQECLLHETEIHLSQECFQGFLFRELE